MPRFESTILNDDFSPVASHTHNGVNSTKINYDDLSGTPGYATSTVEGLVKVGSHLAISATGVLSVTTTGISYNDLTNKPILNTNISTSLTVSSAETISGTIQLHKISKTGSYNDLSNKPSLDFIPISQKGVANGVATLDTNSKIPVAQIPIATTTTLGGIKVGSNLSITADGVLSSTGGGSGGGNEVEISSTQPTESTVELWVDLSADLSGGGGSGDITDQALEKIYPIGSVYMSVSNISPATFLGGTWSIFGAGRTVISVNIADTDFNAANKTGGEKTHVLTTNEMPVHTHVQNSHNHTQAAHTHTLNNHTHSFAGNTNGAGAHVHNGNKLQSGVSSSVGVNDVVIPTGYSGTYVQVVDGVGDHTHSFSGTTGGNNGNTSSVIATNNAVIATNQDTGGEAAHNNLMPYITVYMWVRTS